MTIKSFSKQSGKRSDVHCGLANALNVGDTNADAFGKQVIPPSFHLGCELFTQQVYQEAIELVKKAGKSSLFVAFISSPPIAGDPISTTPWTDCSGPEIVAG